MSSKPADTKRLGPWDAVSGAVILAVVAAQLLFAARDVRMPRDPGLYYKLLPDLYAALAHPLDAIGTLAGSLAASTGWYNLSLALAMRVLGRGPLAMELACAGWVALLLLGTLLLARRAATPVAGLCAVSLVASMPGVIIMGRTPWIHIPEAALAVLVVAVWQRDPALQRWRTVLAMALAGMALLTLRHSGLVWLAPLAPALLWTGGHPRAWGRIAALLVAWSLAVAVPVMELQRYLEAKMGARDRYVDQLPQFLEQTVSNLSWPTVWACMLGIVLFVLRRPRWPRHPLVPLLTVWLVLGVLLWTLFRAGLDNFTPVAPALAILAGLGLARLGRWGALPALLCFFIASTPQWLDQSAIHPLMRIPGFPDFTAGTHPNNHYRPWTGFAHAQVRQLLDATCAGDQDPYAALEGDRGCVVAVDHGLFSPFTEDPGKLELFLMGADQVHLISLRDLPEMPKLAHLQALATYDCIERESDWRQRYPNTRQVLADMLDAYSLRPVWKVELSPNCIYLWMTPDGEVANEAALPSMGMRVTESSSPPRRDDGVLRGGPYRGLPPQEGDAPLPPEASQ